MVADDPGGNNQSSLGVHKDANVSVLPSPQSKFRRIDWAIALGLVALTVATRIPYMPPVVAHSDGAEYAFALAKFDLTRGYPHAPGYPLYVLCAKPIYALTGDANLALLTVSIGFSALTSGVLYLLGTALFGRLVGLAAALLLFSDSNFWRFGVIWMSPPAGVFWATLVALTAYRARIRGGKWGLVSAACLGLGGGFRQQVLTFLGPLWLWCCRKLGVKQLALGLLIIAVLTGAWIGGVSQATGGCAVYKASSDAQWREAIFPSSVFYALPRGPRATVEAFITRLTAFFHLLLGGRSHLSALAWALPLCYALGRLLRPQLVLSDDRVQLLVAWLVPMMLFHLLIHMNTGAHALAYLPPLCLMGGVGIYLFCADLSQLSQAGGGQPGIWKWMVMVLTLLVLLNVGVFTLETAPRERRYALATQSVIDYIQSNYTPLEAALVQSDLRMFYHAVHYYLPEHPGYLLQQTMSPPRPSLSFPSPVRLDEFIRYVIFLNPDARVLAPSQMVKLDSEAAVRVTTLSPGQRYMHFGPEGVWFSSSQYEEATE